MNPELDAHLLALKKERAQYIEMFAAAFTLETGVVEASKYKLVETVSHEDSKMVTTWEFQLR
jgi:hypothetical protein